MKKRRELEHVVEHEDGIPLALRWAEAMIRRGLARGPVVLRLGRERRSLDQNAKLWPMLEDIAKQVEWMVDGQMQRLSKEEWKDILTAGVKKHQRVAAGVEGGFVMLGAHTSRMNKREFSALIEFIYWFGTEKEVTWSEPAKKAYEEHREKAA